MHNVPPAKAINEARWGEALIAAKPLAQRLAADPEVGPLNGHGGERTEQVDNVNLKGGNQASYLVRRLKRDRPDLARKLANGEFPSARAAAIAAGIVTVPTAVELGQRAGEQAPAPQRSAAGLPSA